MCTLGEGVIEYKFEDLELRLVAINIESTSVKSPYNLYNNDFIKIK